MGVRPDPLKHGRWWDATLNVVGGCKLADDSCYYCYAPRDAAGVQSATDIELYKDTTVWKDGRWTWNGKLTVLPPEHPNWTFPRRWPGAKKPLLGAGKPSLLWVNSMADLFAPGRPVEHFHRLMEIVAISRHIGLVLTKYPAAMVEYFSAQPQWWRRRFWLGFSAGDQRWWDVRWKIMRPLAEQGWLVFTSIAPMLTQVTLPPDYLALGRWVICGGEQHPGHREMKADWARALVTQCKVANPPLPIFVKQMTRGWLRPDLQYRELPKV